MYYNYHGRNKERIRNGELVGFQFCERGEFAVVLQFKTYPHTRPIRAHSLWLYEEILRKE